MRIILFTITFFFNIVAYAQTPHIQDYANILSPKIKKELDVFLNEVESKKKLLIEEIILPLDQVQPSQQELLRLLDKTSSEANQKVLLVINSETSTVHIITTPNLNSIYNDAVKKDITENVLFNLKAKKYDEMARVGVAGIYHYYEKPSASSKKTIMNVIFLLLGLVAVVILLRLRPSKTKGA